MKDYRAVQTREPSCEPGPCRRTAKDARAYLSPDHVSTRSERWMSELLWIEYTNDVVL